MEEGGWCDSYSTCQWRSADLRSSNEQEDQRDFDGIFSDDPNQSVLHDANKVFVKYCSSDIWFGDHQDDSHPDDVW